MTIQENIPLAPLTTLRVGGAARYFVEAASEHEVRETVALAKRNQWPLFILGGGSNLVVADSGWPGLVLKIAIVGIENNGECFEAGAGVDWDEFVARAVEYDCSGIECLSGIPGSVGATPVQNVGAYGQDVSGTIESVRALDLNSDRIVALSNRDCGFAYRTSIFNTTAHGRYIIVQVTFRLQAGGSPSLKYADLQKYFSTRKARPSLADVRTAVREIRRGKGMLIVPGDEDSLSAGSFFKNPVLSEAQFQDLLGRAEARELQVPSYPALSAQHKVSAAWLVEHSGFSKGYEFGRARISHKHALALVNSGDASAAEVVRLKEEIQRKVEECWRILLEPEPVFVGF
jgi:UDP-N-acetylmuramate dehydrogenase